MKKLVCVLITVIFIQSAYSQPRPNMGQLVGQISTNAVAYLLSANRPSYGVNSYITPKGYLSIGTGVYFNKDVYEIPVDFSIGLSKRFELSGGFSPVLKSFNYLGEPVSGIGDANIGFKVRFQESDYFDHSFQTIIKIPTASNSGGLGTGKVDYYFGLVQGFGYRNFGYDLSIECNLLQRRDFPSPARSMHQIVNTFIDSLKKAYNYKYEPEISLTFSPSYSVSENLFFYTGYNFTRNTRLNFNTSSVLAGFGVAAGEVISFSAGSSYGLTDDSGWLLSAGINALIPLK